MVSEDEVRRAALTLPETEEADHHRFPSFRVRGKIFCTLRPGQPRMMLKLPAQDQWALVDAEPETFEPVPGYWGRKGSTFVALDRLEAERLPHLLRLAWSVAAPKRLSGAVL